VGAKVSARMAGLCKGMLWELNFGLPVWFGRDETLVVARMPRREPLGVARCAAAVHACRHCMPGAGAAGVARRVLRLC